MKKDLFIGALAGGFTYLFGGWDKLLECVLVFIVIDIITGVTNGWIKKTLNSKYMGEGLIRKAYELLIIVIAYRLDVLSGSGIFRTFACYFFIANEGLSILENIGKFIPYPKFLKQVLEQLQEKGDNGETTEL